MRNGLYSAAYIPALHELYSTVCAASVTYLCEVYKENVGSGVLE
jgi:hypothetical protein